MAEATKTWSFLSDVDGWTGYPAGSATLTWEGSDGSPAAGCLESRILGKNQNPGVMYWEIVDTWEGFFGIASGSAVTQVGTSPLADYNHRCAEYVYGYNGANYLGPFEFFDNVPTLQGAFSAEEVYTGTTSWATKEGAALAVASPLQPSNTTVRFRLSLKLRTGNSDTGAVRIRQDEIKLTITYTPPGAGGDVFFENRHAIEQGMKAATAAGMGGVLIE
ncbi:MAG TPA: hypothetical protein VMX97_02905 [Hyphomicrobiaceae bacterium]|nr:hypothetical protein [Hyphomicrobiaceae bacterium]